MKKIFAMLALLACNSAFSQIDIGIPGASSSNKENEAKFRIASRNAEYNGSIVGFAKSCNFEANDYGKVEALLFKNFNAIELSNSEIDSLRSVFSRTVDAAQEKSKFISRNECLIFGDEFKKIINTINGVGQPSKN